MQSKIARPAYEFARGYIISKAIRRLLSHGALRWMNQ